jgi:hypothetical protein
MHGKCLVEDGYALSNVDYRKYYHLERYLFDDVTKLFEKNKTLSAYDFFCIVIWKANRAKSKVAERLLSHGHNDLNQAVSALIGNIAVAQDEKARMKVLVSDWGFRLPMASAILTVLYSNTFTVYDVRVCEVLGNYRSAQNRTNFDAVWSEYEGYIEAVKKAVTENYELREKDRWLWGKSFSEQLQEDIRANFKKVREENETEA